jgi:hypothetical protein
LSTGRKFKRRLTLNGQEILKFLQNTLGHEWIYEISNGSGLTGKCVTEFDGRNVFKVPKTEDTFTARARGEGIRGNFWVKHKVSDIQ